MSRTTLIAAALTLTAPALADAQARQASQAVGRRAQVNGMRLGKYLRFPESAVRRRLERSR